MNTLIPARLKAARKRADMTQAQLADALGFKDRQTLTAIEAGERKLSADELLRAISVLGVDLDFFTDGFRLTGEASFSWRTSDASDVVLQEFEETAGRWIATYMRLGERLGWSPPAIQQRLVDVSAKSSFEQVQEVAEQLVTEWALGPTPADRLAGVMSDRLGILVLHVDAPKAISGAACRVPGVPVALINRAESEWRRHFDLAHELFHLLTWEQMTPSHDDQETAKRVEQLADNFAAALLMPRKVLVPLWAARGDQPLDAWIGVTAAALKVSTQALGFRIVNLGWIMDKAAGERARLPDTVRKADREVPLLFGRKFLERLHEGVQAGHISMRRASSLTGISVDDLSDLCVEAGLPPLIDS